MLLKEQYSDSYSRAPSLVKKYMDLCYSNSLNQLIMEPTRTNEHSKMLLNHIIINPTEKMI